MKHRAILVLALAGLAACSPAADDAQADDVDSQFLSQPLVSEIYTADPSAHVWDGKIYVYPSHDIDAGIPDDDLGSQYAMRDYRVPQQRQRQDQEPAEIVSIADEICPRHRPLPE